MSRVLTEAGLPPGSLPLRARVLEMTDAAENAVLRPRDPGGLEPALRAALAARIATATGAPDLADRYAADAGAHAPLSDPGTSSDDPRLAAILAFTDLVALHPRDAGDADIAALTAAGVAEPDIVRLTELVACLAYRIRLVMGLRLMGAA